MHTDKLLTKTAIAFGLVLYLMSFMAVKIGIVQLGQMAILMYFIYALGSDIRHRSVDIKLLLFFSFFGVLMTLVSFASPEPKIDEFKFIIKYLLIFPAAFYIGQWAVRNVEPKMFIRMIEIVLFIYVVTAFILYYYPLSSIMHIRPDMDDFMGTFFEPVNYAIATGIFVLTSYLLRHDEGLYPSRKVYALYIFTLLGLIMSHNKTIWIAYLGLGLFFLIIKWFIIQTNKTINSVSGLSRIHSGQYFLILTGVIMILFLVNNLMPNPIVSWEMIQLKLESERGKAFFIALDLLGNSDWIGGYGFGYVQYFFSRFPDGVIGLGDWVGMIFNSYLDVWISAGIIGLLFHLTLLRISYKTMTLLSMALPIYLFLFANTNPVIGSEYYYLFLGISYGWAQYQTTKENR